MYEEMKQRIISGYYASNEISEEDYIILCNNNDLALELFKYIINHEMTLKISTFDSNNIFNLYNIFDEYEYIIKTDDQKLNYYYCILTSHKYASFNYADIFNLPDFSDEYKEKLKNKYEKYLLTTTNNLNFIEDDITINKLLDLKRYELIKSISPRFPDVVIEESTKERLKREYPFNQVGEKPKNIFFEIDKYNLDYFTDEDLISFYLNNIYPEAYNYLSEEKSYLKKSFMEFIERLSNKENVITKVDTLNNFNNLLNDFLYNKKMVNYFFGNQDNYKRTLLKLAKNGLLVDLIDRELYQMNNDNQTNNIYLTRDERRALISKQIKIIDDPISYIRSLWTRTDENYYIDDIINMGHGLNLLLSSYSLPKDKIEIIKNNIKQGKEIVLKKAIDLDLNVFTKYKDEELIRLVIDYVKSVTINLNANEDNPYFQLIKESILKNKIDFTGLHFYDKELFDLLYEKKQYQRIVRVYGDTSSEEKKQEIINWLEEHVDNIVLVDKFLSSDYTHEIPVFKVLLKNELFIDKIINLIKHDEKLTNLMDKEIFDLVKVYYSKKYNCNLDNMELLSNSFGPNIIFYLDNENIIELINLDKSDLIKIINLFPMDRTLIDIEATNESLLQYEFKQDESNKAAVDLFKDIKEACSNNDKKKLELKKDMLISMVDYNFYLNLKKQIIDPDMIKVIEKAFELYEQGKTFEEITNIFNEEKLLNKEWKESNIDKLINNPLYEGSFKKYNELKKVLNDIDALDFDKTIDFLIDKFESDEYRDVLKLLCDNAVNSERRIYVSNYHYKKTDEYNNIYMMRFIRLLELRLKNIDEINEYERELKEKADQQDMKTWVSELFDNLSKEFIVKTLKKYNYSSIEEMVIYLTDNLGKTTKATFMLNEIVNNGIIYAQSKSKKDVSLFSLLGVEYDLEEKSMNNEIEKFFIRNCKNTFVDGYPYYEIKYELQECLKEKYKDKTYDEIIKICDETIDYYCSEGKIIVSEEAKKNIGTLFKIGTKIIRNKDFSKFNVSLDEKYYHSCEEIAKKLDEENRIKRNYKASVSDVDIYSILVEFDMDLIKKNLLDNETNYNKLFEIMNKTKPHLLEQCFIDLIEDNNMPITSNITDIGSFISFFGAVMEKELKDKDDFNYSITDVLNESGVYAAVNSVYALVLGQEDAKIITRNPKPNPAYIKTRNKERLKEAIDYTLKCYDRDEVLIPSFDEIYKLENNKELEVIVGNFTAPCNMTHGERTGACMRIGGAGEKLFEFCINDKAGFHIRFEDPKTHEYVSRVSGFRNGNSVFLNQLRLSKSKKYDSNDLYETTKWLSDELIKLTKDTDNPIENVFVTISYAMEDISGKIVKLNGDKVVEGLGPIYTDFRTQNAFILASVNKEGYEELKTGNKGIKPFKPVRSKPRESKMISEATSRVNRVKSINQLKNGIELSDIVSDDFQNGIIYVISTDDWYIYVTETLDIVSEYITGSEEARIECDLYKGIIAQQIQLGNIKEVNYAY